MADSARSAGRGMRRGKWVLVLGGGATVLVALITLVVMFTGGPDKTYTTFAAIRGPLDIKVLEGGNIEALESQEIKSQVKGWQGTKILFIVEEGRFITDEDVANELKLVELDGSELRDKLTTAEIEIKGTQASLTEAQQGYEIQVNQSESDIYSTQLELTFAKLELEKYLGSAVTGELLDTIEAFEAELAKKAAAKQERPMLAAEQELSEDASPASASDDEAFAVNLDDLRSATPDIDFSGYARPEMLGSGEASQTLRKLKDDLLVAEKEMLQSKTELEGKQRLFDKGFVTQTELDNALLAMEKQEIGVTSAETAEELFVRYEFPKQGQKLLSDYVQARRKLTRTEKLALSQLAQARAKLLSAEARYKIQSDNINELRDQIEKCVMTAERAGLVVYGGSGNRYWDEEPIKEGATVRERQAIITIPDMSKMAVKTNIHESDIKKVSKGQKAKVRVDAFPDRVLTAEVIKVAVLPDSENRWMNPDLKVYETTVQIEGTHEWLKPGMSAEVEIIVKSLDDCLYIPIQSVVPQGEDLVCFVVEGGEPTPRVIETADITVEFVTITSGLEAGEEVLIRPPDGSRRDERTALGNEPEEAEEDDGAAEETGGGEDDAVDAPSGDAPESTSD